MPKNTLSTLKMRRIRPREAGAGAQINPAISWSERDSRALQDYALISRIRNSETGHIVVVIGGLYTYGTQAAGEFLTDPQLMQAIARSAELDPTHPNLQSC